MSRQGRRRRAAAGRKLPRSKSLPLGLLDDHADPGLFERDWKLR
jgi:hypothetical protein